MLAHRTSSAFVCIRCELKLARPRLSVAARRLSHPNFSTSAALRNADEEPAQSEVPTSRPRLSEHPLGRLRKRKGRAAIRETIARLEGAKTLGDDAQILVLKEVGGTSSGDSVSPEIVSTAPQDAPNIVESLQQESRPLTPQEIVEQLDSLRPKTQADPNEPDYISQSVFVKLSRSLLHGFTAQQLSHYYSVTKGVKPNKVGKEVIDGLKQLQSEAKRPAERSAWHPGTTQIKLRLPGLDVHHRPKRKPISKHLLVDQILRDVWKLVLLEEIESPGELELLLKPWQLTLLSSGATPTPLDRIGKDRKARIEVYNPDSVLRITADKHTAEYAADDIEQLLQSVETKRFHVRPWRPYLETASDSKAVSDVFPQESLQMVTKMAGAVVQPINSNQIMLRAMGKSAIKEAELCLIKLLPLKSRYTSTIDTTRRDEASDQTYLCPINFEKTSVEFKARDQRLGRWMLAKPRGSSFLAESNGQAAATRHPISAKSNHTNQSLEKLQAQVVELMDSATRSDGETQKQHDGQWAAEPQVQISAQFGNILFPLDHTKKKPISTSKPSTFLPVIPGLGKFLTDDALQVNPHPGPPVLEYAFVAAPEQLNYRVGQAYPHLHVQFRYNQHTGKHFLRKLALGFNSHAHNVLLPDKVVDLCINRHIQVPLQTPTEDENIKNFVQAVLNNIESGEKLSAPDLTLDIPKWTIPGFADAGKTQTRAVKYLFTGVRFRQSVAGKFLGTDVSYSTTQGGKLGRKGGQLSAYCNTLQRGKEDVPLTSDEVSEKLGSFLKSCLGIADRITQAATHDQPMGRSLKVRDEQSVRKLRRQALQSAAANVTDNDVSEVVNVVEAVDSPTDDLTIRDETSASETLSDVPEVELGSVDQHIAQPIEQTASATQVEDDLDYSPISSSGQDIENGMTPYPSDMFDESSRSSADIVTPLNEDDEPNERGHVRLLKTVA